MESYIEYICSICKNKDKNLCNIVNTVDDKLKCAFYERATKEKKMQKKSCYITAKQKEPVMRGIV